VQDAHDQFSFLLLPTIYVSAAQGNLLSSSASGGDRTALYNLLGSASAADRIIGGVEPPLVKHWRSGRFHEAHALRLNGYT
jgi:hypothetical protein